MAAPFVELNEAAKMLGLTPDELVEMRSNGEIRGFRDGASWKFKMEEIQRVQTERAKGSSDDAPISFDDELDDLNVSDKMDDDAGSILVTDEAGHGGETSSSTIIGKSGGAPKADSDLRLSADSDLTIKPEVSGTDLKLVAGGKKGSAISLDDDDEISLDAGSSKKGGSAIDSDVALVPGVGTDSDVRLVPDTGSDKTLKAPPGVRADVLGDSELKMKSPSSGGTGALPGPAGTGTGTGKALGSGMLGSGDLDIALDSELALSDDDEMVLGGSGTGSDLSLSSADSGINLSSPTDSGLSLEADSGISLQSPTDSGLSLDEEPLEMGGSSISELELPEDEAADLETIEAEPAPNLKKDEDFLLTPSDEMLSDESDSGSQVIALEDSAAFDQDAATMLQANQAALLADTAGLDQQLDALGGGGVSATPVVSPTTVYASAEREAPYSVWNILGLAGILLFLCITGVFMSDIVRNMWAWEEGLDASSSIAEGITKALGW